MTVPDATDAYRQAVQRGARGVVIKLGAAGAYLKTAQQELNVAAPPVAKVVDTVGAGDSFTAAMVLGLLRKMDLDEINTIANEVARYVCSQPGATPALPIEFARRFWI